MNIILILMFESSNSNEKYNRCLKKKRRQQRQDTFFELRAAARQFKIFISFLASCNVDVGEIGHSQNNFDDILYSLETVIKKRVTNQLKVP